MPEVIAAFHGPCGSICWGPVSCRAIHNEKITRQRREMGRETE